MPHHTTRRPAQAPRFLALGCVGLFAPTAPALAQTAHSSDQSADLGGVTVTDTAIDEGSYKTQRLASPKATADLIDTPRSITVVSRQLLDDTASASLSEALRTVPGITLGAGEGGNPLGDRPFIRGADSSNSLYLDGVRDMAAQTRETFDIDQIEVTKGSDSVTNGAANAGGSINMVSKSPTAKRFAAAEASLGNAAYKRFTLDLNQPLGENVGFRLNALYHDQGVAGRDAVWQKRWGVAPSLKIGMDGPTSLQLDWYHLHSNELPDSGIPYYTTLANQGVTHSLTAPAGTNLRPRGAFYGLVDRDFRTTNTDDVSARFEHHFDNGLMLRNTLRTTHTNQEYVWTQPDDSKGNVATYGTVGRRALSRYSSQSGIVDQADLSGKFDTGALHHSFAAALEYNWEKSAYGAYYANGATGTVLPLSIPCPTASAGTNFNCTSLANPTPYDAWTGTIAQGPVNSQTLANETTFAASLFDTITLGDKWVATLGGRYDHYLTHASAALPAPFAGSRSWVTATNNLFTYQAGLAYKPRPNGTVYVSTSSAAVPPGSFLAQGSEDNSLTTLTGITANDLKVQRTTSYELGTKWNLMGDALSLTADIFQTRTTNARTTADDGVSVAYVGLKRVRGVELGFSGNVTRALSLFGGYTYMDARILNAGTTKTTTGSYVGYAPAAATGHAYPNTPKHSFTLFANYQASEKFTLGGGAIYMSRVYGGYSDTRSVDAAGNVTITSTRATYVPAYWRFDANASYKLNRLVSLKISALNLTDKLYYDEAYPTHYAHQAAGRTVIGTLAVKY